MSFTEFPIPSVELVSVAADARSAINAMANTNTALNTAIEVDLPATLVSLQASDGENGVSDAGKLAKFDSSGVLAVGQSINLSSAAASVVDADAIAVSQPAAPNTTKKATLATLWSWVVSKIGAISSISAGGAWTFTGSTTVTGASTFNGQMELSASQAATTARSAVSRAIGDARYGTTHIGIKEENVSSTNTTPVKLTSVTLPIGVYQIDSCIAATSAASPNGGYLFGLRASANIKTSLLEFYGNDGSTITNNVSASDSTLLSQRDLPTTTLLTNKRQLVGLIEVLTNNTEVSIEFCQSATSATANTTRKRSYIIARKIS
jgi:hypothetical protein